MINNKTKAIVICLMPYILIQCIFMNYCLFKELDFMMPLDSIDLLILYCLNMFNRHNQIKHYNYLLQVIFIRIVNHGPPVMKLLIIADIKVVAVFLAVRQNDV